MESQKHFVHQCVTRLSEICVNFVFNIFTVRAFAQSVGNFVSIYLLSSVRMIVFLYLNLY